MAKNKGDKALGMDAEITRRDFMDGVAVAIGGTMIPGLAGGAAGTQSAASAPPSMPAQQVSASDYPPLTSGLRGQTEDAKNAGHAVRDGKSFTDPIDTGEFYDLVVVGAGMAGLGAAYFYRKQIPGARVLLIEACPDFGGHAVRNEFMVDGKRLIAGGGTYALWRPNTFPPEAQELLRDIGIDRKHYERQVADTPDPLKELELQPAMFFDKESFGKDRLVMDPPPELRLRGGGEERTTSAQLAEFFARTPYSPGTREGLMKLFTEHRDWMPGAPTAEKVAQLKKMSYIDFVSNVVKIHPDAVAYVLSVGGTGSTNQTAGPDTYSAWYAWRRGAPGFLGMALTPASQLSNLVKDPGMKIRFPDNAATAARLLVRVLIPVALPCSTMDDAV
ncbi:MAG: NAD(P)-binding protein, partial [Chloroflexi bacterium]|nr:NAD(P)-binding protein [Chloroflexota bacterium]